MMRDGYIKIGECARNSGISIRTLHYYEEIGLLVPGRTSKDYRVYGPDDLLRLQQILIRRSLGFSLEEIRKALDDSEFDFLSALKQQRETMFSQIQEVEEKISAIDQAIKSIVEKDSDMTDIFKGFNPAEYSEEVKQRWGKSDAYAQSRRKTSEYSDKDWAAMQAELAEIWRDAAQAMKSGEATDGEVAVTLVKRHRDHICRWFYDCSVDMHRSLSKMWQADERFKNSIDTYGDGLTKWIAQAVQG